MNQNNSGTLPIGPLEELVTKTNEFDIAGFHSKLQQAMDRSFKDLTSKVTVKKVSFNPLFTNPVRIEYDYSIPETNAKLGHQVQVKETKTDLMILQQTISLKSIIRDSRRAILKSKNIKESIKQ